MTEPRVCAVPVRRAVDLAGIVCSVAYGWLAVLSRQVADVPLGAYFVVMTVSWGAMLVLYFALRPARAEHFPLRRILAWAMVFRVIGIVGAPVLEDDFYRYLWDGRNFALTGNPYQNPPIDSFGDPDVAPEFQEILDNINNPDLPTIYAPLSEVAFLCGYYLSPGSLLPLKLFLLLADLATLAILLTVAPRRNLILYAWCPLLIQETFFTAHPDSLGIAFLMAAWFVCSRERHHTAALLAALAVGSRLFALLPLPFLFARSPKRSWLVFIGAVSCLYLPFVGASSAVSLGVFLQEWEFNSSGYALLADALGVVGAKLAAVALFGTFYAAHAWRWWHRDTALRCDWIYGVFFLLAPVLNPWYLLWLLPFVVMNPTRWALTALVAVSTSYAHGLFLPDSSLAPYHHPWWVRPLEFGAIAIAIVVDYRSRSRDRFTASTAEEN